jgi:hypothetical protein
MKRIDTLNGMISFFFVFQVIGILGSIFFCIMYLFEPENTSINLFLHGHTISVLNIKTKIIMLITCFGYAVFVYGIYLFKEILELFSKKIIFDTRIIESFKKIGKCFIYASLLYKVPNFFISAMKHSKGIDIIGGGFDSFLFTMGLGFFFIILSEVFNIAKQQKEENELTI